MDTVSRRNLLAVTAGGSLVAAVVQAAHAQSFGNPDLPPQGAINAKNNPASITDPGPQNPAIASQFPSPQSPPATDVGSMPLPWASFNNAPKRIQNGGWARQVTQADFAISEEISGVNMRLTAGGIRELHWHLASEWAYVTYGNCRITVLDELGRTYVSDVKEGDLWFFPAGLPHSLQGLGPDGCEFVICFDDGKASEFNTLLVTDWLAHTPPNILAKKFGLLAETFSKIPLQDLYIFQGKLPGSLAADRAAVLGPKALRPTRSPSPGLDEADPPEQGRRGADRRQRTTSKSRNDSCRPGDRASWRHARDALASQCRRMAVLDQGQGAHDGVQNTDRTPSPWTSTGERSVTSSVTSVTTWRMSATPIWWSSKCSAVRTLPISPVRLVGAHAAALVAQHLNVDVATIAKFPNDKPEIMPQ
jgi:oxalate decarboxylase